MSLLRPSLVVCLLLAAAVAFADEPAGKPAPLDTQKLVVLAKKHGLPMPPKEAKLVLAHTGSWMVVGNASTSRDPGIYSPAFLLEETKSGEPAVLRGFEREAVRGARPGEPATRPYSLDEVKPKVGGHAVSFGARSAFVSAIQLAERGDEKAAQSLWKRFAGADDRYPDDRTPADLGDQSGFLGACVFKHLRDRIKAEPKNWPEIARRLKALSADFPMLETPENRRFIGDLERTLSAQPPKAGSVEALLLAWSQSNAPMRHLGFFHSENQGPGDAPAREILLRGYEAVPELLSLIEDPRVTVHEQSAFMNAQASMHSLGDLARQLLAEIAGLEANGRVFTAKSEAASLRAWWEKAKQRSEAEGLAEAALRDMETPVRILAHKHSDRLPALLADFLKTAKPDAQPYALADAIATSRLPVDLKMRSLADAAGQGSLQSQRWFLQALAKVDSKLCTAMFLQRLEQFPKDVQGAYWTCPEASCAHLVIELDDPTIWRKWAALAKRSAVGLRMEMMQPFDYAYVGAKNRSLRLACLALFLDDATIRDKKGDDPKFEGPCAAFTIPRIAMRDFVADKLASILEFDDQPDEFWTADQWAKLRAKVRERLAKEKLPDLK